MGRAASVLGIMLFLCVLAPAGVRAQGEPDAAARQEARERFGRGLELYNEGQSRAALAEFQRAYDLAPAYQVLYNLGKVYAQLGDAVRSTDAFEQFLREGGDAVSAERRAEVEEELSRQRPRIARVTVQTNVPGSTIIVDGSDVATTPLSEPLRVTAGEHVIGARAPGHDTATRRVQLAGGVRETLELELHAVGEQRGAIRVRSELPGVEVRIDGRVVGVTPLEGTLSVEPGTRVVEARRVGYETQRETIEVDDGAEAVVRLNLRVDPEARPGELGRLRLRVPDAAYVLRVDGRQVEARSGSVDLPVGEHDVVLEVADREPVRETIEVPSGGAVDLDPALEWTPAAREERRSSAATLRSWGWWLTIGGGVLAAVGGAGFVYFDARQRSLFEEHERLDAQNVTDECKAMPECGEMVAARSAEINAERPSLINYRNAAVPVAAVGVVALGAGIVMLLLAPSDEDIEAEARAAGEPRLQLGLGLGSLTVTGAF